MKKLVVMGLAMAMTVSMMNGVINTDVNLLIQKIWKLLTFLLLLLIMQAQDMM